MRVKFTMEGNYGKACYVSPPLAEDIAQALAKLIAESHPSSRQNTGDYTSSGENFLVMDQTASAGVELVPDEVAITPKQFADAKAAHADERAREAAKKATEARKAAELVSA